MKIPKSYQIINSNSTQISLKDENNILTINYFENQTLKKLVKEYERSIDVIHTIKKDWLNLYNRKILRTILKVNNLIFINYWFEKDNCSYRFHYDLSDMKKYNIKQLDNSIIKIIKLNLKHNMF